MRRGRRISRIAIAACRWHPTTKKPARIHVDVSQWTGVLCLSRTEDCVGGTEFYRHKPYRAGSRSDGCRENLKAAGYSSYEELQKEILDEDALDRSKWELSLNVPLRFNRLMLIQPHYWHTAGPGLRRFGGKWSARLCDVLQGWRRARTVNPPFLTEVSSHYFNPVRLTLGAWPSSANACSDAARRHVACALASLWAAPAQAESDFTCFPPTRCSSPATSGWSPPTAKKAGSTAASASFVRAATATAISSLKPQLGNANLIWQPQFSWSLSATVVGSLQGGEQTEAGLSQAYLSFRPMRRQARFLGPRRPDVAAGQPRA